MLQLTATDRGEPARSANATVLVLIDDANDNNPVFMNVNSNTRANVTEVRAVIAF